MQALVTGVAGFIGAHVARQLLQQGWSVCGIDDLSGGTKDNVPQDVSFEQQDCCGELDPLFDKYRPEVVFHLAAYAAEGLSHHIPSFNYQNNLIGTSNVLSAAYRSGVRHFVFTSSIAAYGHSQEGQLFTETMECRPCDPYGVAKLACEQHIAAFHAYFGSPTYTIFRPHNVFGPLQNISDPFRNVVGIFFRCVEQGLPLPVFGDGSQTRNFSYIDDVAKCIVAASEGAVAVNQIFNVGGDEAITVSELAERVQRVMGKQTGVTHLKQRHEVKHAEADHQKIRQAFPEVLSNSVSIGEGLERTAAYLKGRPIPARTACPATIEILDRLPPAWKSDLPGGD